MVIYLFLAGRGAGPVLFYLGIFTVIATISEILRLAIPSFNRLYTTLFGFLMRYKERHHINSTIWFLYGAMAVLYYFPLDLAGLSIVYLSWCDVMASIIGRKWGHMTPRWRNKSLAGTLAAVLTGMIATWMWYGWIVPLSGRTDATWVQEKSRATLPLLAVIGGLLAGASELLNAVLNVNWLDDNLAVPLVCSAGLNFFLWVMQIGYK